MIQSSAYDAQLLFGDILDGDIPAEKIKEILIELSQRGETTNELIGAALAMRARMIRVPISADAIDVCGTGGDGLHTLNISTAVAFVVAACGVPVAKHGNRAVSSTSGSSDVLGALGITLSNNPEALSHCLNHHGLCFIAAPHFHPALAALAALRREIGTRTIFNQLGPLCNPAGVTRQLVGVYHKSRIAPVAQALNALGSEHFWVVCGYDGLDELSISDTTQVTAYDESHARHFGVSPHDAGLCLHPIEAIVGGTANTNATALIGLLEGQKNAYRDAVLLNAAAALIIAGQVNDLESGAALAAEAIDSGRALTKLTALQTWSKTQ